nr:FtsX-like permease family protein [Angustibacter aerolatus]
MRVADVAATRAGLTRLQRAATAAGARTTTRLPAVLDRAAAARREVRRPLPLVALQAVLLALVALGSVGASVAEQRRPDVALARLRGRRPLAAAATVVGDLALVSVLGCLLGGLAGWALARVVAAWWLPDDVPSRSTARCCSRWPPPPSPPW